MLSQQLHYHDADVRAHTSGRNGVIWLGVEENGIQVVLHLRDAARARDLARQLTTCADRVEAASAPEAETPAETLASA